MLLFSSHFHHLLHKHWCLLFIRPANQCLCECLPEPITLYLNDKVQTDVQTCFKMFTDADKMMELQ